VRLVVIGAGAVGGVVGGRLAESGHEVVFVARGPHGRAIAREGLRVASPERSVSIAVHVAADTGAVPWRRGDVALVAVKSQDSVAVLDALAATAPPELPVVCLQNGVNNEREALRRFERVYGATVMCPSVHLRPGRVVAHSAPTTGVIDVGCYPTGVDDVAAAIADALTASTFSSLAQPEIAKWKWRKLITNLGNAIEAVCGPPARQGPIGEVVRGEAEAVLDAAGIDVVSADEDEQRRGQHLHVQPVDGQTRPGGSSWQSLSRATGTIETDYLNGEIVMLGRLHGVATPANAALQTHARRLAITRAEPGSVDPEQFLAELDR
jgi:2-dehydropantoate 2-reductase